LKRATKKIEILERTIESELEKLKQIQEVTGYKVEDLKLENSSYNGSYSIKMTEDKSKEVIEQLKTLKFIKNTSYSSDKREAEFLCLKQCPKCTEMLDINGKCDKCSHCKEHPEIKLKNEDPQSCTRKCPICTKHLKSNGECGGCTEKEKLVALQKAEWEKKLEEMKVKYKEAQTFEKKKMASPEEKIKKWQTFQDDYLEDNPFSTEDDDFRVKAECREKYWEEESKPKIVFCDIHPKSALENGECKQVCPECKAHFDKNGACEKCIPTGWPPELWKACWNVQYQYMDFTEAWASEAVEEQNRYSKTYQAWYAKKCNQEITKSFDLGKTKIVMMLIPPGKYLREGKLVLISKPFWCGKTEVTQAQWESVMGSNPSSFTNSSNNPVESVTWTSSKTFCDQTGMNLLTEAQWEYVCRAGTTTAYSFGENITPEQVNYNRGETVEVGSLPANAWGLYEMHGNVWEWCEDWYGEYPLKKLTDPKGPVSGSDRVIRGGCWSDSPSYCSSVFRCNNEPESTRVNYLDFRLNGVLRDFGPGDNLGFRLCRPYP
ncbi:MAG: SUMF1/EgtB/PvdO family nonheme iron enzyme, partial [Planctomycetota bacterium]